MRQVLTQVCVLINKLIKRVFTITHYDNCDEITVLESMAISSENILF
jgi:hypothetical protein